MGMVMFGTLFPQVASKETRTVRVVQRPPLPQDTYGLVELFCVEEGCDCRRVILNVHSERTMEHLATINFAFDPDDEPCATAADPHPATLRWFAQENTP